MATLALATVTPITLHLIAAIAVIQIKTVIAIVTALVLVNASVKAIAPNVAR